MHMQPLSAPQTAPAPAPDRVCALAIAHPVPDMSRSDMTCIPLLLHRPFRQMMEDFCAAPQFAGIDARYILDHARNALGVILVTESDYYARQAALYLASMAARRHLESSAGTAEDVFWQNRVKYAAPGQELLDTGLAVLSPQLLDPSIDSDPQKDLARQVMTMNKPAFDPGELTAPALLVASPAGKVLSVPLIEQLSNISRNAAEKAPDVFIALRKEQIDPVLLEELRFTYGFQVCHVGEADLPYLRALLQTLADEMGYTLSPQVDPDHVIQSLRQHRRSAFTELDLSSLLLWALQNKAPAALTTKDLLFTPYAPPGDAKGELADMIGLTSVKAAIDRILHTILLEESRRKAGKTVVPMVRSMAFSGPPGTGKSVTARLLARILFEEGVGTGRFVEAGREQLIGRYMGHTSPMVASLFQQAQGGVLFIDEAGALLNHGHDAYAVEAVNALVRHMELNPDTIVIFATYPGEMEQLLGSNPGLSSRVARVLDFPAYGNDELWEILGGMARQQGYTLPAQSETLCRTFFTDLRQVKGDNFGNGREVRRLFHAALEEMALRAGGTSDPDLSADDLRLATEALLVQSGGKKTRSIGF